MGTAGVLYILTGLALHIMQFMKLMQLCPLSILLSKN